MRISEKVGRATNDGFRDDVKAGFQREFDVAMSVHFSIVDMCLQSSRDDGERFTVAQTRWLNAFEAGYERATSRAIEAASR